MLKAVILVGGPQKGTRFRPLSLDTPKPLFPIAGRPIIQHHIEACVQLKALKEILIIGYYSVSEMEQFVGDMQNLYNVNIRYLQEFTPLGTAGGMYHFRDQIGSGNPKAFFVLNGDVCADFPLQALHDFHMSRDEEAMITIMSTEATRQQSLHYGCLVFNKDSGSVSHYQSIKHFKHMIEGRNGTVLTDHKPVTFAFMKNPEKASLRQLNQLDFIGQYTTDIRHIPGKDNIVADLLGSINVREELNYEKLAESPKIDE